MSRIVLHIDRLVLRGVSAADAAVFSESLRSELASRLADPAARAALLACGGNHKLNVGSVQVPHGQPASATGQAVAGRIVPRAAS
ncbi:hypothetical protein [Pseudomonas sp. SO81]|uniref:hypothetical protein n=1 Tax=Pseudomonas sp. SO81 TaxID=2983246 RepID=UPI0025A34A74|nr:hypothetical protein [Pseudomonas sp. SO81]